MKFICTKILRSKNKVLLNLDNVVTLGPFYNDGTLTKVQTIDDRDFVIDYPFAALCDELLDHDDKETA